MSEFKLPHVEDLATNSKLPGQLTENFEAIEQVINRILTKQSELEKEIRSLEKLYQDLDKVELNSELVTDTGSAIDGNDGQTTSLDINQTENITLN
ncbi:hypothetical protein DKZ27_06365 [Limosilactobacillus reuteri]|uniref:hypothetical protein n=1 Tax=Limosilactobacillus reuteri TaxID=1598 RepID=UPI000D6FF0EA|nr:hypothetical protein [Limosilactobacillus reuteri]PWT30484.1 hypothetical protein DKZ27_06365 [Limosilactobacillus reuteri]